MMRAVAVVKDRTEFARLDDVVASRIIGDRQMAAPIRDILQAHVITAPIVANLTNSN
jgi:hypothetical protein